MSPFGRALNDGDRLEVAGAVVTLKINRRARRVSLRLDRTRRQIVATAPSARRLPEAAAFARERAGWIAERLAELPPASPIQPGMTLILFGETVALEQGAGRARWHEAQGSAPHRITAMGEGEGFARAVILIIKKRALAVLTERTAHYAVRLGAAMAARSAIPGAWRWRPSRWPTTWPPTSAPTSGS